MIVILRPGAQKARVEALMSQIKQQGVDIHYSQGATETILGLVGDTTHVDEDWLRARVTKGTRKSKLRCCCRQVTCAMIGHASAKPLRIKSGLSAEGSYRATQGSSVTRPGER